MLQKTSVIGPQKEVKELKDFELSVSWSYG